MAAPERPLAVIGDVHGCLGLLNGLRARIRAESPEARTILVGDMIDRGPDSRGVLEQAWKERENLVALRGNHEQMMLDFLDDPETAGARWLRHGGAATLASFGVTVSTPDTATRDSLRRALPPGMEDWLRTLPLFWQSGNVVVTHAGADPRTPLAQQNPDHLLWGHPGFGRVPRRDGLWIIHGHNIVGRPRSRDGVVSIDTGAWRGGGLTAALIFPPGTDAAQAPRPVRFLTQES
ncbi:serine/threonine protein phosphatase [Sinirhodobacter populi]|uniref:Serine/threonine protein phosphatase n=1 Tax=Paenirhodobacter populi TaxID=2306993 RepID=A0A443KAN4_9RHOB|nr:metallophosphoesterase family protein [Sinirhodobacter populi]RWR29891.1 serine/threonine protein phosphatase [Sinirhodobacter populi]